MKCVLWGFSEAPGDGGGANGPGKEACDVGVLDDALDGVLDGANGPGKGDVASVGVSAVSLGGARTPMGPGAGGGCLVAATAAEGLGGEGARTRGKEVLDGVGVGTADVWLEFVSLPAMKR